ncbi:MAG: dihydrolipoyl dehydrogenase [Eggerthellaceae bacterium]|nr:dihydrolipoyl dehydrogenase [Eggerthellaceae bacterium]
MSQYQVAVIGAGPGGYVCAIKAALLGLRVVLVEQAEVGGTCLNRGCIPTKAMLHAGELLDQVKDARTFGLSAEAACVDFPVLRTRVAAAIDQLRSGVEDLIAANGIDLVRGKAAIESPTRFNVEGADGVSHCIEAENIVIATGSAPALPPIEGIGLDGVYTSDTLLEKLPELHSLAIIGGGVIGMEFASVYASFGAQVSVLEALDSILPGCDRELSQGLRMTMRKRGCAIEEKALVKSIAPGAEPGRLTVDYEVKGVQKQIEADAVLVATGRRASPESLFAEGVVPACSQGRIEVDAQCRTSVEGIFAIGDVSKAGPQLAHAASAQGIVAACAIAGKPCDIRLDIVPSCVYTTPEIAWVGMTEAEAKARCIEARTGRYSLAGNAKSLITDQSRSFVKVVADEQGAIIGAQLMCARATDIVSELALGISQGLTADQMLAIMRPHPTYEEAVGEALEALTGASIHTMPR